MAHVVDTCVPTVPSGVEGITYGTFHREYRVAGELIAVGVIDIIPEGMHSNLSVSNCNDWNASRCAIYLLLLQDVSAREETLHGQILVSAGDTAGAAAGRAQRGNALLLSAGMEPEQSQTQLQTGLWTCRISGEVRVSQLDRGHG